MSSRVRPETSEEGRSTYRVERCEYDNNNENEDNSLNILSDKKKVLFDEEIGPYQVLPLRVRVDLGVMTMQEYSTFS